jgi:DNA-binding response OmpR family regulator
MIAAVHILIVEDEPLIARFLARGLHAEGYETLVASDGAQALSLLSSHAFDLVVLDLLLPVRSGFDVLEAAAGAERPPPVLVLSARQGVDTKVAALDGGACDYLAKPFSFDELLARVRAQLRLAGTRRVRRPPPASLRLDPRTREVRLPDGQAVELSAREFAVVDYLARRPGEVVSRERLLSAVWQYQFDPRSNIVDVYVGRLRRKLRGMVEITAVRNGGYVMRPARNVAREEERDGGALAGGADDGRLAAVGLHDRVDDREA